MKLKFQAMAPRGLLVIEWQHEKAFALPTPDNPIQGAVPSAHEESGRITLCKQVRNPNPTVSAEPALNGAVHDPPRFLHYLLLLDKSVVHESYLAAIFLLEQRKSRINCIDKRLRRMGRNTLSQHPIFA